MALAKSSNQSDRHLSASIITADVIGWNLAVHLSFMTDK
jgi:hypothetical protein